MLFSRKEKNSRGVLTMLSLFIIFSVGKAIIKSEHLLFYIICLVVGIIVYFSIEFIQKKKQSRPTSLGRKYAKKYPIIIQYFPPKGINPAEAGLLYNRSVEPTDLTSLIYQWKFEKLIDIKILQGENTKKEYVKLIKLKDIPLTRPLFESEIFNSIFALGDIKLIEGPFQLRYALMLEDLEYHGIQKGWLYRGKTESKKIYTKEIKFGEAPFIGLFYLLILTLSIIAEYAEIPIDFTKFIRFILAILLIILGIITLCGKFSIGGNLKFTDKGAELASQIIGYSQFIKSCDENKIKLLLKEDPLFIDRTLPYATAFGMETEFLKKVSPLKKDRNAKYVRGKKIPSWTGALRILFKNEDNSLF